MGMDFIPRQKTLGIQDSGDTCLFYINSRLKTSWADLHAAQKAAGVLRQSHLEDLGAHKGEEDGTPAAKELKNLIHIEKVRQTARKHGRYL